MHIIRVSQARSLTVSSASELVSEREKELLQSFPAEHVSGGVDAEKQDSKNKTKKKRLYLSVGRFSTVVLIVDTVKSTDCVD